MSKYLSLKNWGELQHYKNRTPPWIKLHNSLIENYAFEMLDDASKGHLICIMLLASRTNNKMIADKHWIGRRIGANTEVNLDLLIESGFLVLNQELSKGEHNASKALHKHVQTAIENRGEERRGEEKREEEKDKSVFVCDTEFESIDHFFEFIWIQYERKGNKKTSLKKLSKLKHDQLEKMARHVPAYVASTPDKQYRKNFETYINQESWNDEIIQRDGRNDRYTNDPQQAFDQARREAWGEDPIDGQVLESDVTALPYPLDK